MVLAAARYTTALPPEQRQSLDRLFQVGLEKAGAASPHSLAFQTVNLPVAIEPGSGVVSLDADMCQQQQFSTAVAGRGISFSWSAASLLNYNLVITIYMLNITLENGCPVCRSPQVKRDSWKFLQ